MQVASRQKTMRPTDRWEKIFVKKIEREMWAKISKAGRAFTMPLNAIFN